MGRVGPKQWLMDGEEVCVYVCDSFCYPAEPSVCVGHPAQLFSPRQSGTNILLDHNPPVSRSLAENRRFSREGRLKCALLGTRGSLESCGIPRSGHSWTTTSTPTQTKINVRIKVHYRAAIYVLNVHTARKCRQM